MKQNWFFIALLVGFLSGVAGCDDDDGGASPCDEAMSLLCSKACECTQGDECSIAQGSGTLTFDTLDDCRGLMVTLGCQGGGDPKIDFPACTQALSDAQCVEKDGKNALEYPDVCNAPEEE